jgi:recombination protein RecT
MANYDLKTLAVKDQLKSKAVKQKFEDVLGKKAPQFISSLINVVNSNSDLKRVDQSSVIASALVAAALDLPINQNFGYMYIVPYGGKAQPQMGYKGYIQLAQRSGQYLHLNAISVYEDEFDGWNPLTEELRYEPNFHDRDSKEEPVGYVGYFKLQNGFEKTVYWTRQQIDQHRQKFSKMSGKPKPSGVWASDFDAMALKTVLRNLIGKWGPMTVDMQTAFNTDEEVADVATDETVDVTPEEEPATDVNQLIGGVEDGNSNQEKDSKQQAKSTEQELFGEEPPF